MMTAIGQKPNPKILKPVSRKTLAGQVVVILKRFIFWSRILKKVTGCPLNEHRLPIWVLATG